MPVNLDFLHHFRTVGAVLDVLIENLKAFYVEVRQKMVPLIEDPLVGALPK